MPEYLAPGVYVEETSFRAKSIEGVSTTTTGFIGPARYGPIDLEPDIVTSLAEFERVYGDGQPLLFGDLKFPNYLWHAVRAFFEEGGRRLYIARTFEADGNSDGRAFLKLPQIPPGSAQSQPLVVKARFPGAAGDLRISFRLVFGGNLLAPRDGGSGPSSPPGMLQGLLDRDVVGIFMNAPEQLREEIKQLRTNLDAESKTDPIGASTKARSLIDSAQGKARSDADLLDVTARNLKERSDVVATEEVALLLAERARAAAVVEDAAASAARTQAAASVASAGAREDVAKAIDPSTTATPAADALETALGASSWPADAGPKAAAFATEAGDFLTRAETIFNAMKDKGVSATERSLIENLKTDAAFVKADAVTAADLIKNASTPAERVAAGLAGKAAIDRVKGVATLLADLKSRIALPAAKAAKTAAEALSASAVTRATTASAELAVVNARVDAIDGAPTARLPVARQARDAANAAYEGAKSVELASRTYAREISFALAEVAGLPNAGNSGALYLAHYKGAEDGWSFLDSTGAEALSERQLDPDPTNGHKVCVATVSVTAVVPGQGEMVWSGLPLDPGHARDGKADHLLARLGKTPGTLAAARAVPFSIGLEPDDTKAQNGIALAALMFDGFPELRANQNVARDGKYETPLMKLGGGNDGVRPGVAAYEGRDSDDGVRAGTAANEGGGTVRGKTGLRAFEDIEDISIVAAPGVTDGMEEMDWRKTAQAIVGKLIGHCEGMRYRVAIIDSGNAQSVSQVRSMKAKIDSAHGHAALYYPWVRIMDPITRQELNLPPSGFVAGIYARNDIERGVHKAPANEIVRSAIGFETTLNKAQQEVLNPEGVNCFRFFEGRGFRLWGARTVSSDPEWKYVNVRRYFCYLERSIDKNTQWAVFEPNGEALWANVRRTIEDFLLDEWQKGALLGDKPEKAYFVRCDRSTMSQNDIDNGRLICLIGVAPLKPAEFVIFRIGQWTADRKN